MEESRDKGKAAGNEAYTLIQEHKLQWVYSGIPCSMYFCIYFLFFRRHVLWGKSGEGKGQQRWNTRKNEAAGDEPDKTRDGMVGEH